MDTVYVCEVPVTCATWGEILSVIDQAISDGRMGLYASITNTESMYHALRVPTHKQYIQESQLSLCDGVGVVVAGWVWGHKIPRRNGPILQLECCKYGVSRGWRHFFYGGNEGVADKLVESLLQQFPGMISAGTYFPPYRELTLEEDEAIVERINDAQPDVIWVGLGLLKQERWIAQHLDRIRVPWMVGVGAAFDYHSGVVPRAPRWMRAVGMEWIYCLIIQPKRRAKRYWWSLIFVLKAAVVGLIQRFEAKHK